MPLGRQGLLIQALAILLTCCLAPLASVSCRDVSGGNECLNDGACPDGMRCVGGVCISDGDTETLPDPGATSMDDTGTTSQGNPSPTETDRDDSDGHPVGEDSDVGSSSEVSSDPNTDRETEESCVDEDGDGHVVHLDACPQGDDYCDDDPDNYTSVGCVDCVDRDGDGRGAGCDGGEDCDDNDPVFFEHCLTFLDIPEGSFWMGSPDGDCPEGYPGGEGAACAAEFRRQENETLHYVTLTHPFKLMDTELTRGAFARVFPGWRYGPYGEEDEPLPVYDVDWFYGPAFANGLSRAHGLEVCYQFSNVRCEGNTNAEVEGDYTRCTEGILEADVALAEGLESPYDCAGYRLPTEAEWEYTARAGTFTAFYNGDITEVEKPNDCDVVDPNLEQIAWFWCTDTTLMPGKLKQPNAWGLYDMLGHVAEWVWDYLYEYEESGISAPLVDPVGDDPGEVTPWNRVFRGGSTSYSASGCRAAHRGSFFEDSGATCGTGIRLAITAGPGVAQPTDTATETDSESDMDAGRDGGAQQ